jgi:hypothetical protein
MNVLPVLFQESPLFRDESLAVTDELVIVKEPVLLAAADIDRPPPQRRDARPEVGGTTPGSLPGR